MCHWIHTLKELGQNDATVTADYPLTGVFKRNGQRTYAAYNADAQPLTVTFSDGKRLVARPRALTVQP